jgi:phosphatidylserine/phosphatidylglycerophosphate/cardiolipin synthase-like enzyme
MNDHLLGLADNDLRGIVMALRSNRLVSPFTAIAVQRLVPGGLAPAVAGELQGFADQGFTPQQLATMLDLLVQARSQRLSAEDMIDLVTTGPERGGITNRDTGVVVRELFAHANESVLVAGYAVYQGQRVFQALADRMQTCPGLRVRLFLDIQRGYGDTTTANELVARFAERFREHQWPRSRPLPHVYYYPQSLELSPEIRTSLHAKCVVVDSQNVFVSSANFTEAAHDRNIEIGLLLRSRLLAERIVRHFDVLASEGFLRPVY